MNTIGRRFVAECVATSGLVFAGTGSIIINNLTDGRVTDVGIGLTFGMIIAVMVFSVGHISGAHINPAVTFGFALTRDFPWREVPIYWSAQLLGALIASGTLRLLLGVDHGMGVTEPTEGLFVALATEGLLTFFLMFVIMSVATDVRAQGQTAALAIGMTIALSGIFAGPISGASLNPARSLAPALVGWEWTGHWIYWVGPIIGAMAGALVYSWLRDDNKKDTYPWSKGSE